MEFTSIIFFFTLVPALLFLLLPAAAVIALQVWLCRRDRQWLGLILPALTLVLSLTVCLGALAFSTMTTVGTVGMMVVMLILMVSMLFHFAIVVF